MPAIISEVIITAAKATTAINISSVSFSSCVEDSVPPISLTTILEPPPIWYVVPAGVGSSDRKRSSVHAIISLKIKIRL